MSRDPAEGVDDQWSAAQPPEPDPGAEVKDVTPAADLVLDFIGDQLSEARATKSSLETRANGVVTSAGTLTTLLFALAALVTGRSGFELPTVAKVWLVLAVVAFLLAIVSALRAARPATYFEAEVSSLKSLATTGALSAPSTEAQPRIARALVAIIEGARRGNTEKARDLRRAVEAELAAAVLLGAAVVTILVA